MADRQTGSVWTHFSGEVLTGPLAGTGAQLEIRPMLHTSWEEWTSLYPDTLVMDWDEEFANRYRPSYQPGREGLGPQFMKTIINWDERLSEGELVLGANICNDYRAYVLSDFNPGPAVVNDFLNQVPVAIFVESGSHFGIAYQATVNGQALSFSSDGTAISDETGSTWDLNGLADSGPLAGTQLEYVTSFVTEWYGWAAYHPNSTIYGID